MTSSTSGTTSEGASSAGVQRRGDEDDVPCWERDRFLIGTLDSRCLSSEDAILPDVNKREHDPAKNNVVAGGQTSP
jgi:hypothetical protein